MGVTVSESLESCACSGSAPELMGIERQGPIQRAVSTEDSRARNPYAGVNQWG